MEVALEETTAAQTGPKGDNWPSAGIENIREWWSVPHFARALRVTRARAYQIIEAGDVIYVRTAVGVLLEPESATEYVAEREDETRLRERRRRRIARMKAGTPARASGRVHTPAEPARERVSA